VTNTNLDELSSLAQTTLMQSLQTQAGIESAFQNGMIQLHLSGRPSLMVRVLEVSDTEGGCVAQLGVRVSHAATREEGLIDVTAGIERSADLAVSSAVDKWLRFTFPPIHAAFAPDNGQIVGAGITQLVAQNDQQWQIFSGNPLMIGLLQDQAALEQALGGKRLFPDVIGDALALQLGREVRALHWLKVLVASVNGGVMAECQFDNHEWPELDDLIRAEFKFPPLSSDFLSLTQFLVIRPA
jgi:hypothetical protein